MEITSTFSLLLASFEAEAAAAVTQQARAEELTIEQRLFETHTAHDLFFPLDSVISLIQNLAGGSSAEMGMVGPEGVMGVNALVGVAHNPHEGRVQGRGMVPARRDPVDSR